MTGKADFTARLRDLDRARPRPFDLGIVAIKAMHRGDRAHGAAAASRAPWRCDVQNGLGAEAGVGAAGPGR